MYLLQHHHNSYFSCVLHNKEVEWGLAFLGQNYSHSRAVPLQVNLNPTCHLAGGNQQDVQVSRAGRQQD